VQGQKGHAQGFQRAGEFPFRVIAEITGYHGIDGHQAGQHGPHFGYEFAVFPLGLDRAWVIADIIIIVQFRRQKGRGDGFHHHPVGDMNAHIMGGAQRGQNVFIERVLIEHQHVIAFLAALIMRAGHAPDQHPEQDRHERGLPIARQQTQQTLNRASGNHMDKKVFHG